MIITSLLDTDLYKFTMMQVVLHHFPAASVEYRFKCRTPGVDLVPYIDEIRAEVRSLCELRFTDSELDYLRRLRFVKSDFVDFLALFHLNEKYISITPSQKGGGEIDIEIKGPWLHTILFEIPVLAIVNEVYFRNTQRRPDYREGRGRLREKIKLLGAKPEFADCKIADYGTRRRFSKVWHEEVLRTLQDGLGPQFAGTSNVYYAMTHEITPLGTMAHEYLQACQALGPRLRDSQTYGLEMWAKEYRGDLGIALSDVYGMDAFLRDFDMYFCKLFDNRELKVWTRNHEYRVPWTPLGDGCETVGGEVTGSLRFVRNSFQIDRASSGGQLVCPRERASVGEPVRQPAGTAACGGRPQAEERVPVPLGAREARAGRLSTGGRANRKPRDHRIHALARARIAVMHSHRAALHRRGHHV
ncbi:nicotinate phosphoribosyltransferase [Burkholderia pseudomallei]|nr:nicotinate phosphoribosyltransferase [Burkholderia pseudomallei]